MGKLFVLVCLLCLNITARENPFFPSIEEKDMPYTTNSVKAIDSFTKASLKLPSSARVIRKVTVEYQNLDGSMAQSSVDLYNSVDWHIPIFISQNYVQQLEPIPEEKKSEFTQVAHIEFAKFHIDDKTLKITTEDKSLRDFLLGQPHRIVIDFKRDSRLKAYTKKLQTPHFKKIRIGNHDGYYRVVIELDGYYKYTLKQNDSGYLIELN